MIKVVLTALALLAALPAGSQVFKVDSSGNVTATGQSNSTGFQASGTGAGILSCSAGAEPTSSSTSIGLTCPSPLGTGYYFIFPAGPAPTSSVPLIVGAKDGSGNVALSFGTFQGNTTSMCTATGSFTSTDLLEADASGNVKDSTIGASSVVLGATSLSTQYGLLYNTSTAGTVTQLSPNTVAKPAFLTMTGTGSAGAAPTWSAISGSTSTVTTANANVTSTNSMKVRTQT